MRKMNDYAQANQMLMLMVLMFLMIFVFGNPDISAWLATSIHTVFYPLIGFGGSYPVLTLILAGIVVVFLSSFFQNLFTDWKKMAESQELSKAFQKEMSKERIPNLKFECFEYL